MKQKLLNIASAIAAFLTPVQGMIGTAVSLVIIDLITGVIAAKKRGEKITSSGFKGTAGKLCIYLLTIILSFVTQKYLTGEGVPLTNIVGTWIGVTEFFSIMENMNSISGGSMLKSLLEKLNSFKQKP